MPESVTVGAFVFGAVLILVGLLGGRFKIFNVEVSGTAGNVSRAIAFALGGVMIILGIVGVDQRSDPNRRSIPDEGRTPDAPSQRTNISGRWRDPVLGTWSEIVQEGQTFRFTGSGPSCIGGSFVSSGTGTIRGRLIESRHQAVHQSSVRSEGNCSGTVSSDGSQIRSNCNDSLCRDFATTGMRE